MFKYENICMKRERRYVKIFLFIIYKVVRCIFLKNYEVSVKGWLINS